MSESFKSPVVIGGLVVLAILLVVLGRPSGQAGNRVAVHGHLTEDGQPIEAGTIYFVPEPQTEGPTAAAAIDQGDYALSAEKGPGVGDYQMIIQVGEPGGVDATAQRNETPSGGPATIVERIAKTITTRSGVDNEFSFDVNELRP